MTSLDARRSAAAYYFVLVNQSPSESLIRVARGLAAAGHRVDLVCGGLPGDTPPEGVRVVRMARYRAETMVSRLTSWGTFAVRAAIWLAAIPAEATVLACTNPPIMPGVAVWVSRVRRFAVVARVLDVYPEVLRATASLNRRFLWRFAATWNRLTYAKCCAVETLGPRMSELIAPYASGTSLYVIPESVDIERAHGAESAGCVRSRYGLPADAFVVLVSGNIGMTHCLDDLAAAAALLREESIWFLISTAKPVAVRKAFGDGLHVAVMPRLSGEEYRQLLREADLGVITLRPGVGAASFPSRTLAYLAARLPIIAITDAPSDLDDLVRAGGAGTTVVPGAPGRLADAIRALCADAEKRLSCSRQASILAERYDAAAVSAHAVERMEEVARRHIAARGAWLSEVTM